MQVFTDFEGREIILSDDSERHIVEDHPEIFRIGITQTLNEILKEPDVVMSSRRDLRGALYYKLRNTSPYQDRYVCVVVKFLEDEIYIWTAYITTRIRGGRVLWTEVQ